MKTNTITAGAVLRLTQESDIALLPAIERSAAQAFRQIPSLAWLADSEVISVARHHDYLETEHSLLAVAAGQPVGFILTEPLDDALFIVEFAVHQPGSNRASAGCCWSGLLRAHGRWATRR